MKTVMTQDVFRNSCQISRFVCDPRDLLISEYFYHKRGAEPWLNIVDPKTTAWKIAKEVFPEGVGKGFSFSS